MNGYAWLVAAFRFYGGATTCAPMGFTACRKCTTAAREVSCVLVLDMPKVKR